MAYKMTYLAIYPLAVLGGLAISRRAGSGADARPCGSKGRIGWLMPPS